MGRGMSNTLFVIRILWALCNVIGDRRLRLDLRDQRLKAGVARQNIFPKLPHVVIQWRHEENVGPGELETNPLYSAGSGGATASHCYANFEIPTFPPTM